MDFRTGHIEDFMDGWEAAILHLKKHPAFARRLLSIPHPAIPAKTDSPLPSIQRVIFNDPATIILWNDGTKTVVKCQPGDTFSAETGLAMAMLKRFMGNDNTFNNVMTRFLGDPGLHAKSSAPEEIAAKNEVEG